MSMVLQNEQNENNFNLAIDNFFRNFKIGSMLKASNVHKEKGIPSVIVIRFLLMLIFKGKNLFMALENKDSKIPFAKDVAYRFLKFLHINWQKFLFLPSSRFIYLSIYLLIHSPMIVE